MKCNLLFALTLGLCVPPFCRADDALKDLKAIQGTWLPTSAELASEKFPDPVLKTMKLVLQDDKYTVTVGNGTDRGTIKIVSSAKPKAMDVIGVEGPNKGKTFPAIYQLDGDTLKICYDLSGKARPKEFLTKPNTKLYLAIYQREKP